MPRVLTDIELLVDAGADLAEGPVWDDAAGRLLWVDLPSGAIHTLDVASGADEVVKVPTMVGAVATRAGTATSLIGAIGPGFGFVDRETGAVEWLCQVGGDDVRMNDGGCDPQGRFWAGAMAMDAAQGAGTLYCLTADGRAEPRLDGLTIPNGIDWSPDGRTMYFVDSQTHRVDAFDFDPSAGGISGRRPFATVDSSTLPDGLTVDADGGVWVALWDGWAAHRYAPDGELDTVVRLPVPWVTSCAFGGEDLGDLFITTGRHPTDGGGGVYRCRPGVTGRTAARFAG